MAEGSTDSSASAKMDPASSKPQATAAQDAVPKAIPKPSEGNPAFRMMGLPRWRPRLPSRNWMIFLSTVSAFTGAWWYDRREIKRAQKKWCDEVATLAEQPLPPNRMPRRITVVLGTFPGDGLLNMREHFHDYVKPVLLASGLDWDVIEGRKEGEIRAQVAERIREARQKNGEKGASSEEPVVNAPFDLEEARRAQGIYMEGSERRDGPLRGDLVIGRHAWKEYIRGLHEGWLGPLDPPKVEEPAKDAEPAVVHEANPAVPASPVSSMAEIMTKDGATEGTNAEPPKESEEKEKKEEEKKEEEKKKKKRPQPVPFITPSEYPAAELSPNTPKELGPSAVVTFPHIMGFLNSPQRLYRFLNRRYLADDTGREVAAVAFGHYRPYARHDESHEPSELASDSNSPAAMGSLSEASSSEQLHLLQDEEKNWHKSYRKRGLKEDEVPPAKDEKASDEEVEEKPHEYTWTNAIVLDPRIADRMRKFVYER
ncbi:hypothetical protein P152DRAFT_512738 [Eremomyces bilateralis CBS 781.70]|uniref:Mitochondrial import inner membrane translocase subunit TIM54 n=1 Tax=Eremomyces bilateralis CBS 781.70 TaxID=1392243 RepID=A0A6G1G8F9_9PEZI|nr:uncharacterized protein P152DRAFT_512738 [Eremomyces bilateralis CBS 781.70]KAF1814358.1 hypothetical protein P152DRAFT_512738 [Eremomyces bilateralis CBS 781.70]